MKVVFDTNILVSSLIVPASPPHRIYEAWRAGTFVLVTCDEQFEEFRRVTRYDKVRAYIEPAATVTPRPVTALGSCPRIHISDSIQLCVSGIPTRCPRMKVLVADDARHAGACRGRRADVRSPACAITGGLMTT